MQGGDVISVFWDVATSSLALGGDGVVILIVSAIGWLPLVRWLPVIGPYVPTARLVAVLVALVLAFMLGHRAADERATVQNLRTALATKQADIEIAGKSAADASMRANRIEAQAKERHDDNAAYIGKLESNPACRFDPGVSQMRPSGGLRGRLLGRSAARAAGGS
jgi:hypothetical protein